MKIEVPIVNYLGSSASAFSMLSNSTFFSPSVSTLQTLPTLPFPQWLTEFTGLREWPGIDPPYIKLDFINFDSLTPNLDTWIHTQGNCAPELNNPQTCSFDCYTCVAADDAYTCPALSQSFDDGPSLFTPKLTSALTSKSTFFTIGLNVVRYPQIYIDTASQGHIMGCHTWSHKFLPSLTNEEVVAQIEWSIWAMNATYGHLPKWFRPPYGGIDNRIRGILRQFGMQAAMWDYDTTDWRYASELSLDEEEVHTRLDEFINTRGKKGLILEHDSVERTVDMAIRIQDQIGANQLTVPQCVGGIEYIKEFPRPNFK